MGVPPTGMAHYTTVKYAMLGYMKAIAAEYRGKGINVNGISPSMVDTKFIDNIPSVAVNMIADSHPQKRIATTKDVTPAISFLMSESSDFVFGTNFPITGGEVF